MEFRFLDAVDMAFNLCVTVYHEGYRTIAYGRQAGRQVSQHWI